MDLNTLPVIPFNLKRRSLLFELEKKLVDREALVLLGSRRSGKTSLLYLLLDRLKRKGILSKQILFFDLENQLTADRLNEIKDWDRFPEFLSSLGADTKKRVYVFLDEVQYLSNPSSLIKYLVDHYPNLKFIVTGSASIMVKSVFSDSMVGRVWRFNVRPLSFEEFLLFKKQNNLVKIARQVESLDLLEKKERLSFFKSELARLFEEFCLFGGYPEVVQAKEIDEKKKLLARLYSEYVRKDIQHLAQIREIESYNKLVRLLAGQIGQLVSDSELAASLKITRPTVKRFLFLLSETFIIKLLTPYSTNPRQELIKNPKVYFEDSGLSNFIVGGLENLTYHPQKGNLVENCIFSQFLKYGLDPLFDLHFWRTKQKQEVDFVIQQKGKVVPCEVKYQSFSQPKIPSGLRSFINRYKPVKAYVITKNFWGQDKIEKTQVDFFPVWAVSRSVFYNPIL